jgi:hypothetical protein
LSSKDWICAAISDLHHLADQIIHPLFVSHELPRKRYSA